VKNRIRGGKRKEWNKKRKKRQASKHLVVILLGEKERLFPAFLGRIIIAFNVLLQNYIHIRSEFR